MFRLGINLKIESEIWVVLFLYITKQLTVKLANFFGNVNKKGEGGGKGK